MSGCTASVGIGPNKFLAKMATAKAKPDGVYELSKEAFLADSDRLSVGKLPGVGWRMEKKLKAADVQVIRVIKEKVYIYIEREREKERERDRV